MMLKVQKTTILAAGASALVGAMGLGALVGALPWGVTAWRLEGRQARLVFLACMAAVVAGGFLGLAVSSEGLRRSSDIDLPWTLQLLSVFMPVLVLSGVMVIREAARHLALWARLALVYLAGVILLVPLVLVLLDRQESRDFLGVLMEMLGGEGAQALVADGSLARDTAAGMPVVLLLLVSGNQILARWWCNRHPSPEGRWTLGNALADFRLPAILVWPGILALATALLLQFRQISPWVDMALLVALLLPLMLYCIQGLGILSSLARRVSPMVGKLVLPVFVFLLVNTGQWASILVFALVVLGILELWIHFRPIQSHEKQGESEK